jgi:Na+-driven multidrug efflux pump
MQLAPARERGRRRRRTWPSGRLPRLRGQDREILRLAVPAFGALVAEPLFLLADSAIVGRIGTVPLGGLGVASLALTTLVNISIFLACGTRKRSGRASTASGWPPGSASP